jgi:branched-chain amino acid transport system permease protein
MAVSTEAAGAIAIEARPLVWGNILKEAGLVAFVMFGLTVLMVGIEVRDVSGGLALHGRYTDVFAAMIVGFVGRIVLALIREKHPKPAVAIILPVTIVLLARVTVKDQVLWIAHGVADVLRAIIGGLLSIFELKTDLAIDDLIPFQSSIVTWILFIASVVFLIMALRATTREAAAAHPSVNRDQAMDQVGAFVQRISIYLAPALIAFALALPWLPFADLQIMDIAVLVVTYIMLGWGLNIVVGLAGLLDLGYVAFYAVGAYSFALLATRPEVVAWSTAIFGSSFGFWICLPFAGMMSASAGVLLGFPVLRLRGDYLAIVTLGFGEMIRIILLNWYSLTKGPDGLGSIPRPFFFGHPFTASPPKGVTAFHQLFGIEFEPIHRVIFLYYIILLMAMVTNLFTLRIRKLPIGRAWEALREDEIACRSLGINPTSTKLTAFGIGAMFGGFAGSFFATRQSFISPESFTFIESAVILAIVVLGGMGSQVGVVFAAILLIGMPEIFRDLQQYRMLAFGAAMVLIMLWRPRGLLAHREPTIKLFGKRAARSSEDAS